MEIMNHGLNRKRKSHVTANIEFTNHGWVFSVFTRSISAESRITQNPSQTLFIVQLGEHCSANAEATGSNPVEAPKKFFFWLFSQLLKLRFTAMVTYSFHLYSPAVHIISLNVSFPSWVDELNKLASLQYMGLHSSAGRALQR